MRDNLTDITVLVDRSGSMASIKGDMEGGLNQMIEDQKKEPGECRISLYSFDADHFPSLHTPVAERRTLLLETHYEGLPINEAGKFILTPRGCTPLNDALGTVIEKTGERLGKIPENERPGRVIFITVTDGLENASCQFTPDQVRQKIEHQKNAYQWNFIYLGANQDAVATGKSLGVNRDSSLTYIANAVGTQAMASSLSSGVACLRKDNRATYEAKAVGDIGIFSAEDRQKQEEAGLYSSTAKTCKRCTSKTGK